MVFHKIVKSHLIIVLILSGLNESSTEQSHEPSIGFDLEQTQLQKIVLLDPGPVNRDLTDNQFNIPQDKVPEQHSDDLGYEDADTDIKSSFKPPWELKAPFIPSGGDDLCEEHTKLYLNGLKTWQRWAIQMWDATGKVSSGLYSGNANQLGDFDTCLNIKGPKGFQPNYCLAAIDLELQEDAPPIIKEIVNKAQGENFIRSTMDDPGHFIPRFSTVSWGICVPKSCSKESLEEGLLNALAPLNSTPGLTVRTGIPRYSCHEEPESLPFLTILTISFFAFILLTSTFATILDLLNNDCNYEIGAENRVLMAFSIRRGLKDLFAEGKDEFPCIHGIRAICTILLYVAHRLMPMSAILFSNRLVVTRHANTVWSSLLRASNMYTDSFLFISGVLTSYNLTREVATKGYIKWPTRIITRLIRLTPALFAVVLYYAFVMEHTGSGPQWGTIVTANSDLCKANMWRNLLYIQNFFKFEEMCGPHTHQLALDTQMFVLAPALVYILHSEQVLGFSLMIAVAGASAALRFYTVYTNNLSSYIHHGATMKNLYLNANISYGQTVHRIIPYLIGIGLGYLLQKYRKMIHINNKAAVLGWTLCLIGIIYSIFSQAPLALKDHVYDPFDASLYAAVSPFTWSASLCWIIYMCSIHRGGVIERLLSSRYFLLISRLSFSFYLTQFIAFHYNTGSLRATEEGGLIDTVPLWELMTVFFMSIVLTLTFDLPMQEIKNVILSGNPARSRKPD